MFVAFSLAHLGAIVYRQLPAASNLLVAFFFLVPDIYGMLTVKL